MNFLSSLSRKLGFTGGDEDERDEELEENELEDEEEEDDEEEEVIEPILPKPIIPVKPSNTVQVQPSVEEVPVKDTNSLSNGQKMDTSNTGVKEDDNGVVYYRGMRLLEFLESNPTIRTFSDVSKYYHQEDIKMAIKYGQVLYKKGRLII